MNNFEFPKQLSKTVGSLTVISFCTHNYHSSLKLRIFAFSMKVYKPETQAMRLPMTILQSIAQTPNIALLPFVFISFFIELFKRAKSFKLDKTFMLLFSKMTHLILIGFSPSHLQIYKL